MRNAFDWNTFCASVGPSRSSTESRPPPKDMQGQEEQQPIVGETWLVTGSNRGIGLEFVRHLVALRKNVIATARDLDKGDELKQIAAEHNNCHLVELDIADNDSINRARQEVQRLLGDRPIDVLLNNAATGMSSSDRASEAEPNTVDRILHTNIVGPMQVTQTFLPFVRRSLQPKVIFMSSSMGHPRHAKEHMPIQSTSYNISKAGVSMLNAMFSIDDHCKGITFVALHPGWVDTDMGRENKSGDPSLSPEESVQKMLTIIHNVSPDMNGWMYNYKGEQVF